MANENTVHVAIIERSGCAWETFMNAVWGVNKYKTTHYFIPEAIYNNLTFPDPRAKNQIHEILKALNLVLGALNRPNAIHMTGVAGADAVTVPNEVGRIIKYVTFVLEE